MAAAKDNDYTKKRKVNPQRTEEEVEQFCKELLDYAEKLGNQIRKDQEGISGFFKRFLG